MIQNIDVPRANAAASGRWNKFDGALPEHDLPVLAIELQPVVHPAWDALLDQGVQPALILGAERRSQGKR